MCIGIDNYLVRPAIQRFSKCLNLRLLLITTEISIRNSHTYWKAHVLQIRITQRINVFIHHRGHRQQKSIYLTIINFNITEIIFIFCIIKITILCELGDDKSVFVLPFSIILPKYALCWRVTWWSKISCYFQQSSHIWPPKLTLCIFSNINLSKAPL